MPAHPPRFPVVLLLAVLSAAAPARVRNVTDADAPRRLPTQGAVDVRWQDPAGFAEIVHSHNRAEARRGNWVERLALHLRARAQRRLPAGERLEVEFTDIDRAGDFEPWVAVEFRDTRVLRDLYPPRIALTFRRVAADGTVLAQGARELRDAGYLLRTRAGDGDPLRFEKDLIDRWLARELPAPAR